ncbi:hypothetical protein NIES4071_99820 [Calothrix sp. NIES-4071]|nr:hypothetical protein NIES4071_99820 [Calothrix sp. NIES-4071]BAZ64244.1 hypothetical protein NIES4105_99750 [Calothrix sp. NIES-4105]
MKKGLYIAGFGIAAVIASLLPVANQPAIAQLLNSGATFAQNILQQPKVNLNLVADKKQLQKDAQGKQIVSWKALDSKVVVLPGDVIRFTVTGKNEGNKAAKNMNVTQPIPQRMVYVLNTAKASSNANTTFSIDQGKTFVATPIVKVSLPNGKIEERPAPAEKYTHMRWNFNQELQPNTSVQAAYEVKVR